MAVVSGHLIGTFEMQMQGLTLGFKTSARKGLLIKISGQKQDIWLLWMLFWAPSLKNIGSYAPGKI